MKHSGKMRGGAANFACVMAIASFAYVLSSSFMASAQTAEPAPSQTSPPKPSAAEVVKRKAWHGNMYQTPTPKHGCFKSTYPGTEWQEVPCTTAPDRPYPLAVGPRRETLSGRSGSVARAAGLISTAVGFFDSATAAISESGTAGANSFSLQLNSNTFNNSSCTPPPPLTASPNCSGWQQFIFSNSGRGFMQYWLVGYFDNRPTCTSDCCPSDWKTFKPTASSPGAAGCWRNSANTVDIPVVTLTGDALLNLQLIGRATAGTDSVTVATDSEHLYTASGQDSLLNLARSWQSAEFNIFGDCCGSQANFSSGSTMDVRIDVGGAATCAADGFTAETNNLTVLKPCCTYTAAGGGGGIMFTQSNVAGARSRCDEGPHCLPLGASCSFTGPGCCASAGESVCRNGRCARYVPPPSCNGRPRPTQACASGWHCCDKWVCGQCQ